MYANYFFHVLRYVMKLHISAFCVSGGISYMKSRGLIAPLLVHNVYDACNFIHKMFSYLVLGYIYFYPFHFVLIKFRHILFPDYLHSV